MLAIMEDARQIQNSILPRHLPKPGDYVIAARSVAAEIVGGDFYDFARLDEDHIGLLIGDVSGKGVPAALTMALLLAEFRLCATGAESTAEVMRRLNERMVGRSRRGTFCTAALVALNLSTGNLMAANAGHHPVVRISKRGVSTCLPASGPPVGILEGVDWSDEESVVEPGETLRGSLDPLGDNDFYRLWLDERMVYTCAYYATPETDLAEAQVAKLDHVCRKLDLQPGMTVVEAGCGWGALALHMAEHYGARVHAYNVSKAQVEWARREAAERGLEDRVRFVMDDYRSIDERCDRFVSVGMLEHVGRSNYRVLGDLVRRVLEPDGLALVHSIGRSHPRPQLHLVAHPE